MAISQGSNRALRNPWGLGVIGFLSVVVTVNVIFISSAISSNPGLVEKNYYDKGRNIEQTFQQRREMVNRLGWDMRIQVPETINMGRHATIYLNVVDNEGVPLNGATAQLHAYRPSDASADFEMEMQRYADGIFSAEIDFSLRGVWDLLITVKQGEDQIEKRRRVTVDI